MSLQNALLIRHGETNYNREHRLQGLMPVPLNKNGRRQAEALAGYLQNIGIDALFTSPILRASQTADIIGREINLQPVVDERLREIAFGIFEGHTFAEVETRYPDACRQWVSGYRPYRVPEGESRQDVAERMVEAWNDYSEMSDCKTIALVSHGSAIAIFLHAMFARLPDTSLTNSSITTLSRHGRIWEVTGFAERPHLQE